MRDRKIDSIRAFCNLLLIAVHSWPCVYAVGRDFEFWSMTFILEHVFIVLLPTLFLLSGYLLFVNYEQGGGYLGKVTSRFKRLVLPAIIWNLISAVVLWGLSWFGARMAEKALELDLNSISGWLRQLFFIECANGPLWYIRAIFILALCAPVIRLCILKVNTAVFLSLIFVGVIATDYWHAGWRTFPSYAVGCFCVGGVLASKRVSPIRFFSQGRALWLILALGALVVQCLWAYFNDAPTMRMNITMFLATPLIWCCSDGVCRLMKGRLMDEVVIPAAFFIYMSHALFCFSIMYCLGHIVPAGHGRMLLVSVATICVTLCITILLRHVLNGKAPRVLRFLEGRLF